MHMLNGVVRFVNLRNVVLAVPVLFYSVVGVLMVVSSVVALGVSGIYSRCALCASQISSCYFRLDPVLLLRSVKCR